MKSLKNWEHNQAENLEDSAQIKEVGAGASYQPNTASCLLGRLSNHPKWKTASVGEIVEK